MRHGVRHGVSHGGGGMGFSHRANQLKVVESSMMTKGGGMMTDD